MDEIFCRSYKRKAVVQIGGVVCTLRWYPCHRFARVFPGAHRWCSNNWLGNYARWDGPGEIGRHQEFIQDEFFPYLGDGHVCGEPDWWIDGIPEEEDLRATRWNCCSIAVRAKGTVEMNGTSAFYAPGGMVFGGESSVLAPGGGLVLGGADQVRVGAFTDGFSDGYDEDRYVTV